MLGADSSAADGSEPSLAPDDAVDGRSECERTMPGREGVGVDVAIRSALPRL